MTTTQPEAPSVTPVRSGGDQSATPVVAFLGTGRMGTPMAVNLAHGGFGVRVWNRTASRAPRPAASGHADDDLAAVYLTT